MSNNIADSVIITLDVLNYEEKKKVYNKIFSLGTFNSNELNTKILLINLVALIYNKMKAKNPKLIPLDVLLKITPESDKNSAYYQFLEGLSILVEDFLVATDKIDNCGFIDPQQVLIKIKEILNQWLPF